MEASAGQRIDFNARHAFLPAASRAAAAGWGTDPLETLGKLYDVFEEWLDRSMPERVVLSDEELLGIIPMEASLWCPSMTLLDRQQSHSSAALINAIHEWMAGHNFSPGDKWIADHALSTLHYNVSFALNNWKWNATERGMDKFALPLFDQPPAWVEVDRESGWEPEDSKEYAARLDEWFHDQRTRRLALIRFRNGETHHYDQPAFFAAARIANAPYSKLLSETGEDSPEDIRKSIGRFCANTGLTIRKKMA